jgi:hypothetical protein
VLITLLSCALGGFSYGRLPYLPAKGDWRYIGTPPSKPVRILTTDVFLVYVETESGEFYGCHEEDNYGNQICYLVDEPPADKISRDLDSPPNPIFLYRALPRQVISSYQYRFLGSYSSVFDDYYVILEDGSIWEASKTAGPFGIFAIFRAIICGISTAILFGISVLVLRKLHPSLV